NFWRQLTALRRLQRWMRINISKKKCMERSQLLTRVDIMFRHCKRVALYTKWLRWQLFVNYRRGIRSNAANMIAKWFKKIRLCKILRRIIRRKCYGRRFLYLLHFKYTMKAFAQFQRMIFAQRQMHIMSHFFHGATLRVLKFAW